MTFDRLTRVVTDWAGSRLAVGLAMALVLAWALLGPVFGFSDAWQLVINTTTTVITSLMVFVLQHTQTKDTVAMQAKLDELIRAIPQARNDVRGLEQQEDA